MERRNGTNPQGKDTVLLMDRYSVESQNLLTSLKEAGWQGAAVVIEDDGYLPDDVISCYGSFLGDFKDCAGRTDWLGQHLEGRPRYFNQVRVPDYWQISGRNTGGQIHDLGRERGRIFYADLAHKRYVRVVDWLDQWGVVRSCDHYNRYGAIFARTIFNQRGEKVNRSYFDREGREILVENFVTGAILLQDGEILRSFPGKVDFVMYALERMGYGNSRLFYNSLSTPFFVALRMQKNGSEDLLFWQEPVGEAIPGNMQVILQDRTVRPTKIIVQKKKSYERLLELGADPSHMKQLGYLYPFLRESSYRPSVLICTNSERVEGLDTLARALPELRFHVAALTEMSSRLLSVGSNENVSLYPAARPERIEELFDHCDIYLDINRENEILSAVRKAFLSNLLIAGFQETLHDPDYVAPEHTFSVEEPEQLAAWLSDVISNKERWEAELESQRDHALAETPERYLTL